MKTDIADILSTESSKTVRNWRRWNFFKIHRFALIIFRKFPLEHIVRGNLEIIRRRGDEGISLEPFDIFTATRSRRVGVPWVTGEERLLLLALLLLHSAVLEPDLDLCLQKFQIRGNFRSTRTIHILGRMELLFQLCQLMCCEVGAVRAVLVDHLLFWDCWLLNSLRMHPFIRVVLWSSDTRWKLLFTRRTRRCIWWYSWSGCSGCRRRWRDRSVPSEHITRRMRGPEIGMWNRWRVRGSCIVRWCWPVRVVVVRRAVAFCGTHFQ